jgi:transposase-like protein
MVKNASPILSALRTACLSETAAVEFFEQHRWNGTPACPRCGSLNVYKMASKDGKRNKDFRLRCKDCPRGKQMFTVRTATAFEESRLPMRVWATAMWRAAASKKGISALQLSRECEITHKSALFVLRRIRHGMGVAVDAPKLTGTVEADETFIGGRLIRGRQRGRLLGDADHKTPVVGMVERGGNVRLRMMQRLTAKNLGKVLIENADGSCRLITDEWPSYQGPGTAFKGGHFTVKHTANEYVRDDVHTNTIEGVFSLIKRGVMGTFHSVTRKHLPNYLNEFEFRYNTRKLDDGQRVSKAIKALEGKRLEYRESVDNPPYEVKWERPHVQWGARFWHY